MINRCVLVHCISLNYICFSSLNICVFPAFIVVQHSWFTLIPALFTGQATQDPMMKQRQHIKQNFKVFGYPWHIVATYKTISICQYYDNERSWCSSCVIYNRFGWLHLSELVIIIFHWEDYYSLIVFHAIMPSLSMQNNSLQCLFIMCVNASYCLLCFLFTGSVYIIME